MRFNEPLHVAVNVNTKGTSCVIELWKELMHPISFVHVSVTTGTLQIRWTDDGDKDVAALGDNVYRRIA